MTDEQKRALHNASKALIACGMKGDVAHIESLLAAGASEGHSVELIADELATAYGHHLEGDETEAGHWWTFDREALAAFAKRVTAPSASIADTARANPILSAVLFALTERQKGNVIRSEDEYVDAARQYLAAPSAPSVADAAGAKPIGYASRKHLDLIDERHPALIYPTAEDEWTVPVFAATPASSVADAAGASDLDSLLADITAIDTWHRGSPSYEHDAGWFKDRVVRLLEERIAKESGND